MKRGGGRGAMGLGLAVALAAAVPAARGQALTNASFEEGTTAGWEAFGPGWRVSAWSNETASDAHSGAFGAVNDVKKGEADEWRGISQAVPAEHGMLYAVSAWVKALDVKDAEAFLELQFLDDDGKLMESVQSDIVKDDQPFTLIQVDAVNPPKRTKSLLVRGIVHRVKPPDDTIDVFAFDDFELTVTNKSSKSNGGKKLTPAERIRLRQQSRQDGL